MIVMALQNDKINLFDNGKLDLRPLIAGDIKEQHFICPFIHFKPDSHLSDIEPTQDVQMEGKITNTAGYIKLEAVVSLHYRTSCARCAEPLERTLEVPVEKDIALRSQLQDDDTDDYIVIDTPMIDLEPIAIEELYLGMPMRDLCSDDCRGLCPKCGKNLNEGTCSCPEREPDPRLAILSKWSDKNKQ